MKQSGSRKIFAHLSCMLGTVGVLLLLGSFIAWQIGLETLSNFYESNRPLVFLALAGAGLAVLSIVFSILAGGKELTATSGTTTVPGAVTEGIICCGKCEAINDLDAKFCDQCGQSLTGR